MLGSYPSFKTTFTIYTNQNFLNAQKYMMQHKNKYNTYYFANH